MTKKSIIAIVIIILAVVALISIYFISLSSQKIQDRLTENPSDSALDNSQVDLDNSPSSDSQASDTDVLLNPDQATSTTGAELDIDKGIADFDASLKSDTMTDLNDSNLSDSQLGL